MPFYRVKGGRISHTERRGVSSALQKSPEHGGHHHGFQAQDDITAEHLLRLSRKGKNGALMLFQRTHIIADGFLILFGRAVGKIQYCSGSGQHRRQDSFNKLPGRLRVCRPACMPHGVQIHIGKSPQQAVAFLSKGLSSGTERP